MKEILFLKRFIIGNEIWILYQNVHRKRIWFKDNRSSIVVKPTRRKFFLFIWWDWNSTEFFSQDKTINFGKYYNQLDKLKDAIAEKRSKLVNRRGHDNAKPHIALTKRKAVTVWLGHSITSFVFPRSCFIRLLCFYY